MDETDKKYLKYLVKNGMSEDAAYQMYVSQARGDSKVVGTDAAIKNDTSMVKQLGMGALDLAGRGLDYAGGLTRAGVGTALGQGEAGDLKRAFTGEAPSTEEYLTRAGVPEGAAISDVLPGMYSDTGNELLKFQKGGTLDPNARDAAGFVGDVALDPLTYLSGGLSAAAKTGSKSKLLEKLLLQNADGALTKGGKLANTIANPLDTFATGSAKRNYDKAFEWVDKKFAGDKPHTVAKILQDQGFSGSADDALEAVSKINSKYGDDIGQVMAEATAKGATVNIDDTISAALKKADQLDSLGTPEASSVAKQIRDRVKQMSDQYAQFEETVIPGVPAQYQTPMYGKEQLVPGTGTPDDVLKTRLGSFAPVDQANEAKKTINQQINFNATEADKLSDQARKAVAKPLSDGIKESVKSADQELYDRLIKANEMYSSTSPSVQNRMKMFADQVVNKRGPLGITGVDVILAGAGGAGAAADAGPASFLPLLAKKGLNAAQSVQGRTLRGKAAQKFAEKSSLKDAPSRELMKYLLKSKEEDKKD